MGRSRGGGGGRRPAPRPASRSPPPPASRSYTTQQQQKQAPPPPAPHRAPPPPAPHAPQGGGMMAGLAGTVMQGMALGTGSALAHRAVDSIFSSGHAPEPQEAQAAAQQIVQEQQPCADQAKAFADCMSFNGGNMDACQRFFDNMQQCRLALYQ